MSSSNAREAAPAQTDSAAGPEWTKTPSQTLSQQFVNRDTLD